MIKINFFGDFCVRKLNGLAFDENLKSLLKSGDLNVVNFEGPINNKSKALFKSGPNLYQDDKSPDFLRQNGFNVISFANNHIMDYGTESLFATKSAFGNSTTVGGGTWKEAYQYKVISIGEKKIAFIAVTQYEFGTLGEYSYQGKQVGTAWMCHPYVDQLIIDAKRHCDVVLIIPHAGLEHFDFPLPELCTLYRHYVSMGADAVIGGHPHVPQPWEIYNGKPIVYSLGNFIFDALETQNQWWYDGLMAQLCIDSDEIKLSVYPITYNKEDRVVSLTGSKSIEKHLSEINRNFKDEHIYIELVNKECLKLEWLYDYLFALGGYIKPSIKVYSKTLINLILAKLLKSEKTKFNKAPLINNIRCESHRWVLSRIFEIKYNSK